MKYVGYIVIGFFAVFALAVYGTTYVTVKTTCDQRGGIVVKDAMGFPTCVNGAAVVVPRSLR